MTYTSRELIQRAKDLSQTTNSKAFSFSLLTSLLNNAYTKLYNDLSGISNSFVKYFEFTGSEADLPADCNKVLMVYEGQERNPFIINQSSVNNFITGSYYIENRTIKIVGKIDGRKVTVKYNTLPAVLTAPNDSETIDEIERETNFNVGLCQDDGFYYRQNYETGYYFYDFNEKESKQYEGTIPEATETFLGYEFDTTTEPGKILWNDIDVTDFFLRDENDEISNITNTASDNTHLAILYNNGDLYVMMSDWSKTKINPDLYKGRLFNVSKLYGICADDSTGEYILIEKDGKLQKISFVPDTVIDYPDNVFFDIIIDKIAIQLQALQGLNNDALQNKLTDDEESFYNSLQRSQQGQRIRNDSNIFAWRLW